MEQLDQVIQQALALKQYMELMNASGVQMQMPFFQWICAYPGNASVTSLSSVSPPLIPAPQPFPHPHAHAHAQAQPKWETLDQVTSADGQFTCELLSSPNCTFVIR